MNSETYFAECAKSQQLTKFAVSLIREHYEPSSENGFIEICRKVAEYFDQIGKYELASFVRAQIGDERSFVPQ